MRIVAKLYNVAVVTMAVLGLSCNGKGTAPISPATTEVPQKQKEKNDNSALVKNYNGEDNKLFVFVGNKLSVDMLPYDGSMDLSFKAKYKVIQKVFGEFPEDTIEFLVYDHHGFPAFSKFENVLLYVSAKGGTYCHQKYMYNDVYLTKSGRWAGTYLEAGYPDTLNKAARIKPVIMEFSKEVSYPTYVVGEDSQVFNVHYPKPYYRTLKTRAVAVYGNYVEDLFVLNRDGFLTARGLFKDGKLQ